MSVEKKSAAQASVPRKRKGGRLLLLLWCVAGTPFLLILWPTLLMGAFMLPTLLAMMAERKTSKHMAASIGFMNTVGVLPPLVRLWETGQDSAFAVQQLGDPFNWAVALVAAGSGYLVFVSAEWVVAAYYRWTSAERLRRIASSQDALVDLWGPEVVTAEAAELMSDATVSEGVDDGRTDEAEAA